MIVVLLNGYIALLAPVRLAPVHSVQPVLEVLAGPRPARSSLVGLFIPMGWGAPSGPAAVVRNSVQIVPSVAGEVVEVPVAANTPRQGRRRPVPHRPDHLPGAGPGHRGPAQVRRAASRPDDRAADAATPAAPSTCSSAQAEVDQLQGATRRRQMEPRQDHRAGARRRLRDQSRAAQGRARYRAVAGHGLHRHVGDHLRRGDPADLARAMSRSASRSRSRSRSFPGEVYHREGGDGPAGHRHRPVAARRPRRHAVGDPGGPVHRPRSSSTIRRWRTACRPEARARCDLHRARQGEPRHPAGACCGRRRS